ncbi:hypothetical protein ABIE58_000412 [Roseovarius sp. MBR-78]|uniref:DUF6473 family protein n=1 Tax=Roseovarius sp. MBR-78 TaxID=3156460 RepID=UPI003398CB39
MTYERLGPRPLNYQPVHYAGSTLAFRGPRRDLGRGYVACLGGTETYGRFIARPWPALLGHDLGATCVNLGLPNAGPDVFTGDAGLRRMAQGARAVVLHLPCAMNLSNPFYRVHPRRNDRFVAAEAPLRDLYPEVDFTEFHFTRHLMRGLIAISPARFAQVRAAMQEAWVARMAALLHDMTPPVVLLWLANHAPGLGTGSAALHDDPAFVSRAMLDAVTPHATATVQAVISGAARAQGTLGMRFAPTQAEIAAALPGPLAHREVAQALRPVLGPLLHEKGPAPRAGPSSNP